MSECVYCGDYLCYGECQEPDFDEDEEQGK